MAHWVFSGLPFIFSSPPHLFLQAAPRITFNEPKYPSRSHTRKHATFCCRGETGRGEPYNGAIIVGERKTAAPHSSCELGEMPRGPAVTGSGCQAAGSQAGASQGGRRDGGHRHGEEIYLLTPHLPPAPTSSNTPSASASSVSSLLGEDHGSGYICARPHLVGFSDLQGHRMLGGCFE